ncbi:hypothetical protein J6590_092294 [Homalodisca vitripennis]|nr:hypothetical protein J6590_092294 [Homalodisca vitripennis]
MQHIRYEKKLGQLEYQIQYKETLSDFHEFIVLDLYPARNRNRGRPVSLKNVEQILLYPNGLTFTPFILPVHHPFFHGINSGVAADHCPAALSDEDTAEVEEEEFA